MVYGVIEYGLAEHSEDPPDTEEISIQEQLVDELDAREWGSGEAGEEEFISQGNQSVNWDHGPSWNRLYSASLEDDRIEIPEDMEDVPEQYLDYMCYVAQGDYRGPIDSDNEYYFKYSNSGEKGEIYGCPTPDTEDEIDKIWEWYGEEYEDEIARDNWSGLLWTESLECSIDYHDSIEKCKELNNESFGGRTDWRLPTKSELKQISPYEHDYGYNCNDEFQSCTGEVGHNAGPGSGHGMYDWDSDFAAGIEGHDFAWSQNLWADDLDNAHRVEPRNGSVNEGYAFTQSSASYNCVRCVAEDR